MRRVLAVLAVLAALLCSTSALADKRDLTIMPKVAPGSVPITGEHWALLIGIDKYRDREIPALGTAVKDAEAVRDLLIERYGFKADRVRTLLNEQATRVAIEGALYRLGQQAGPNDSVFIYYAGHGQTDIEKVRGWWVPHDAKADDPATFIKNASVRDEIAAMKAKHVYLVADSCFSGTLFAQSRSMPLLNDKFFARLYQSKSRWGLTSGGTEPVADAGKGGHSIFAYHLIKLLKENSEPYLVPSYIYGQIAPIIANNAEQTPRSEPLKNTGDEGGQFVFRLSAGAAAQKPSGGGASAAKPDPAPSAALTQAEQELKALEEQERQVEEQKKLAAVQQQIEEKKQQVERKKQEVIQEARVRPYEAPAQTGREITGRDGAPMMLVPAGEFRMIPAATFIVGGTETQSVSLSAFYLDKFEVTNKLFQKFVSDTGYETEAEKEGKARVLSEDGTWPEVSGASWRKPEGGETIFVSNRAEHPVVSVSWYDADAYCRWAGKQLPTEAQFQYALRVGKETTYWYGDGGSRPVANLADEAYKRKFPGDQHSTMGYDDGFARTAPVGSFDQNLWGLHDMIGNVSEWTADSSGSTGSWKVVAGGSWDSGLKYDQSAGRVRFVTASYADLGFRCAKKVQK